MVTKVEAASIANSAGITTLLTSADQAREALAGKDVGTLFVPTGSRRSSRKLWLAHATTPRGRLMLDEGAVRALVHRRSSLLPAGVTEVVGAFGDGDAVELCGPDGTVIGRGLVSFSPRASSPACSAGRRTSWPASSGPVTARGHPPATTWSSSSWRRPGPAESATGPG